MRRALVLSLMIFVSVIPVLPGSTGSVIFEQSGGDVPKQSTKELKRQAALSEKVELMGLGAQIRVVMRGSANLTYEGAIDEIAADSFKLKMKDQTLPIQYGQVEVLSLRARAYKTRGQPDPVQVRQVVADMGVGENAKVKLVSNDRFNGTIRSIEKEGFVVASKGNPVSVKYGEVQEIEKKKFPAWGKVAIAAGVVVGLLAALVYSACGSAGCH
jgi:hypothetical protein